MPDIDVAEIITAVDSVTISIVKPNKPLQRKTALAGNKTRIQNENTEQTIITGVSVLHRIIVTGAGAAGTLIVSNGAAATASNILTVLEIGSGESKTFEFNINMSTGIRVTPGETTTDSLIIYN